MAKATIAGIIFVNIALVLYTLFFISESKKQNTTGTVLIFITLAVIFDIAATAFMMIGTTRTYFTFHGILGYIGLSLMIIDTILLWRYKLKFGAEMVIPRSLNTFSKLAYGWWIMAFLTGVFVSIFRH